uniref:Fibronectin type-III domain-containing protein n=1 Tax=Poecilia mexicana TaxID=48701 RepID=A0A3B3WS47_9TELE
MASGAEIESSGMVLISGLAPQANELPGSFRKAEIEGLLPSTMYEITLQGLMEGRRSVPLRVFTATGTPSKMSLATVIIPTPSSSSHCLSMVHVSVLQVFFNDLSYNPTDPSLICLSTSGAGASAREPGPV